MRRNDEFDIVDIESDFTDDEEHSSPNRNEETNPIQDWYQKLRTPFVLIGVGLIGLVILIVILLPRTAQEQQAQKACTCQAEGLSFRQLWLIRTTQTT